MVFQSAAQVYTLTNGNSSASINGVTEGGMYNWTVDGVNHLSRQWFYCRDGSYEYALNTLNAAPPTFVLNGPNQLTATYYDQENYSVSVNFLLLGQAPGSGSSSIQETISIHNSAATPLSLQLFQYSDFDLAGTSANDRVTLFRDSFNLFNRAVQTEGLLMSETTVSQSADHGEANFYNNTLASLQNYSPTTLNDDAGPLGPGDMTWALQWGLVIAPGGTFTLDIDKFIGPVPEPSVLSLCAVGLGIWALRRRHPQR